MNQIKLPTYYFTCFTTEVTASRSAQTRAQVLMIINLAYYKIGQCQNSVTLMLIAHGISSVYISQLNEKLNKKEKASCMDDQIVRLPCWDGPTGSKPRYQLVKLLVLNKSSFLKPVDK